MFGVVGSGACVNSASNFLFTGVIVCEFLAAIGPLLNTNGKLAILAKAAASVVCMATWLSHLELLRITTAPAKRILSIYLGVMGRSVESIAIPYFVLR